MRFAELDRELRGYTIVRVLNFTCDSTTGECALLLQLAKDETPESETIELEFSDVCQLTLRDFGGGLTQVLYIRVEDVSDQQLERIKLRIQELERDTISFGCRSGRVIGRFPARS